MCIRDRFRNLDLTLKYELMNFYKKLQETEKRTGIFVTHDVKEAAYLADRVLVLEKGAAALDLAVKDRREAEEILSKYFLDKVNAKTE